MNCPSLTHDLPGIGGEIKTVPEDFEVEEIPAYEPSGQGGHLFLWIEKRDVPAEDLTRHLSGTLGVDPREIGTAGLKDRRAVTRQFVSVPADCEPKIAAVDSEAVRVLRAVRHKNKLRTGHLRGNRFSILVRNAAENAFKKAEPIARRIEALGFPNYFGPQRFGADGETARLGLELLTGKKRPRGLPPSRRRFLLRLSLSAAQSWLFNSALAQRLSDGLLHRALPGDVMGVVESGGCFVVADAAAEQARLDAGEIVVTGPIFGPKMKQPQGEPAAREAALLQTFGLEPSDFLRHGKLTLGTRRPYTVRPGGLIIEQEPAGLRLQFDLPSGVYATELLREFQKVEGC